MTRWPSALSQPAHPDHDTLATFRRRFLGELADLFVQILEVAQEMKLVTLGTISLVAPRSRPARRATAPCLMATSRRCKRSSRPKCKNC
jgi:hypothetical protein